MKQALVFFGRVLLVCLPQTLVSLVAIHAFYRAGIFPSFGLGTHVSLVLTLQVLYFTGWALLSRRVGGSARPWFRRLYALSNVGKGLMLNLVYLGSYTSYRLWSAYLTWANLQAAGAHLRGFYLALGPIFYAGLAVAALAGLVALIVALRTAGRSLHWLETTYASRSAPLQAALLATLTTVLALHWWFRDPLWTQMGERDPLLAFWTNRAAAEPVLTPAMLADRAAGQAYQVPATFHRRNVIILVIDCLRADHLSFRGYARETTPYLTSLHRAGRLQMVATAVSNGNDSPQGIRALLNSRAPHRQNIHNFRLQDLLKRAGYRTHVLGTGDHTTLGNMREHYGPNLDVFLDGLTTETATVNDDRGLLESLDRVGPAEDQPAFFYFHLMSAHELGVRDPAFTRWRPATLTMDWTTLLAPDADPQVTVNSYDNGILQADHYVREIFRRLEAKGYLRDYVAVIAGDHGQGLGERGHFGHTRFLYGEDLGIPLFFLESAPADYGPLPFASQVDVAPTLLARLGLPVPARWEGQSLYQAPPPEAAVAVGRMDSGWRGVLLRRDGELFKYLFNGIKRRDFKEELYATRRDPAERHNLATDPAFGQLLLEMRTRAAQEFSRPVPPAD